MFLRAEETTKRSMRHVHHDHVIPTGSITPRSTIILRRDESPSSAVTSSLPTLSTTSTTSLETTLISEMPKISATSTSSTSTINMSHTNYIPQAVSNPFFRTESLPTGFVFIVIGSIAGLIFIIMCIARLIYKLKSQKEARKANLGNRDSFYLYDHHIFDNKPALGQTKSGNASIYSLSSNSTVNLLTKNQSMEQLIQSGNSVQGKSYRNALSRTSRTSMFISPTELIRMTSNMELPLSAASDTGFNEQQDSYLISPAVSYIKGNQSMSDIISTDEIDGSYKKMKRPPSFYLEQLLNDDSSDDGSFINYDEKNRI